MRAAMCLTAIALSAPPALAQRPAPVPARPITAAPADQAAIARARAFIRDTMTALGAPGASVAVMRSGKVIWSEGFGFADLEQGVLATPLTRFRVGSVSKALTAAAIGALVETGKLDLDAPVQRYVPGFPIKRWPITSRQLGGHLAGVRHYRDESEFVVNRHYPDVQSGLAIFADDSLLFEPGTRYSYSSFGFNLLSAVIEAVAGEPYLAFMERRVFDAAGLLHTVADHVDSIVPNRARWYTRGPNRGGIINAPATDNSYKWAGGGFLSTTEDLVEFGDAMLHGRLLQPATVRQLWTSQRLVNGRETGYGIGWSVGKDASGRTVVSHGGGSVGGTAMLLIYPEQDLIIAVLVNSDSTFVGATATIAEMFLE